MLLQNSSCLRPKSPFALFLLQRGVSSPKGDLHQLSTRSCSEAMEAASRGQNGCFKMVWVTIAPSTEQICQYRISLDTGRNLVDSESQIKVVLL